ncbi:hypothetical protein BDR26DRAFT_923593 [Obelidium mucronatum]|nr:hypothetical protein BDR26DRAFT_923593 [Obelidium mucronatum]
MVLMAIDHAKGFISNFTYPHEQWFEMPDYKGNSLHFLSRFVTSFCAPGFFMLMGWGVALFVDSRLKAGWSWMSIFKHFALRGAVLVLLNDVMMIPFRFSDIHWTLCLCYFSSVCTRCQYFSSICVCLFGKMGHQSCFSRPVTFAAVHGIFCYRCFAHCPALLMCSASRGCQQRIQHLLFPGSLTHYGALELATSQKLLKWDSPRLGLFNLSCGILMISLAIPLRYGVSWTSINPQLVVPPVQTSLISFFNNVKYPPSVVYTLITIGANQLVLGLLFFANRPVNTERGVLMVFGGSSLFFYVTHFYVYALMGNVLGGLGVMPKEMFGDRVFWFWYAEFKRGTSKDSLWRLF